MQRLFRVHPDPILWEFNATQDWTNFTQKTWYITVCPQKAAKCSILATRSVTHTAVIDSAESESKVSLPLVAIKGTSIKFVDLLGLKFYRQNFRIFGIFEIYDRISQRNRNQNRKYLSLFIRGLDSGWVQIMKKIMGDTPFKCCGSA